MPRLLVAAVLVVLSVVVAGCGPEEDGGPDLSRFAVSREVPPAAGR